MKTKRMNKKNWVLLACAAAAVFIVVLVFISPFTSRQPHKTDAELSVWVAYWDWENGVKDLDSIPGEPDSVQVFAASFNAEDKLFYPKGMEDLAEKLTTYKSAHPKVKVYLSAVNDIIYDSEKSSTKNRDLLDRLLQSDESRAEHVADIMALAEQGGFDGVEIDYEKISEKSWPGFCDFCSLLQSALQEKGKHMRVVLEPGAPITKVELPKGPEYVLMAYNLFGIGTKPGPKADEAFIRKMAAKMEALQGSRSIAFATGGYDWDANGKAHEVTEAEAYSLMQNSKDVQRDSASGDVYFTYQKDDGTHTVWYADGQTLKKWIDLSCSLGIGDVSLWRLGGDRPETLQTLGQ